MVQIRAEPVGSRAIKGQGIKETEHTRRPTQENPDKYVALSTGMGGTGIDKTTELPFATIISITSCQLSGWEQVIYWLQTSVGTINLHIHNWTLISNTIKDTAIMGVETTHGQNA